LAFDAVPLGELVRLRRGYDLPSHRRRAGPVPVVSSRGITGSHDQARVRAPGVVTGRTGTLGGVYFVETDFWPLNTTLFVDDFRQNDPRFVAYLLRTIDYERHNDKAAIPGVHRGHLHEVVVPRPPLRTQRAIGRTLAMLDRRRALLARMDRNLKETTTELYRLVPDGPEHRVDTLCNAIGNGGTPPRGDAACWHGSTPWFPTVGRVGVLEAPAAANQACCALAARPAYGAWFLFHALLATRDRLKHLATGAAQQNISQRTVRAHLLRVPTASIARAFHDRVSPLHALRAAHAREARTLRAWRDTLLPELLQERIPPPTAATNA
jgi:type I restriction enzyme S subunit